MSDRNASHERAGLTLLALMSLALSPSPVLAITFADGQTHVIDASNSFPSEGVDALDGPGASTTSVEVVAGGEIATAIGEVTFQAVNLYDSSRLIVTGGVVHGEVTAHSGSPEITIAGGEVRGRISVWTAGASQTSLSGGEMKEAIIQGGTCIVSGGTISDRLIVNSDTHPRQRPVPQQAAI